MKKNKKLIAIGAAVLIGIVSLLAYKAQNENMPGNMIRIGAILPLTGNSASTGQSVRDALQLAVKDINAEDSSDKYYLDAQDSKEEVKTASFAMRHIMLTGKPKLIYAAISAIALQVQKETEPNGIILFAPVGAENLITRDTKYSYRLFPSPSRIGEMVIKNAKEKLGFHSISIVYPNNEFGKSYSGGVNEAIKLQGINVGSEIEYSSNRSEYINIFSKLKNDSSNGIYLIGYGTELSSLIRKIREIGYDKPIICDMNLTLSIAKQCGDAIDNVYRLDFRGQGDRFQKFQKDYVNNFSRMPDTMAMIHYESLFLFHKLKALNPEGNFMDVKDIDKFSYDSMLGQVTIRNYEILFPMELKKANEE